MSADRPFHWRPMMVADLPLVQDIAARLHPHYPERAEIFADKLAFFPAGCHVAEGGGGAALGYVFAHVWTQGAPPLLDTPLGPPPGAADCLHLHDIALLPAARGQGGAERMLARLNHLAHAAGMAALTLVAIRGQEAYWCSKGFVQVPLTQELAERLASYGDGVAYMRKAVATGFTCGN